MKGKLRMNGEKYEGRGVITRRANDGRQKTESDRDRGGGRSTHCVSYLSLSVLADRIEVFSIYANHSHRHRIITALCQESSPSAQSLHPFLTSTPLVIPHTLPFHSSPRNPCSLSPFLSSIHIFPLLFFTFCSLFLPHSLYFPLFQFFLLSFPLFY